MALRTRVLHHVRVDVRVVAEVVGAAGEVEEAEAEEAEALLALSRTSKNFLLRTMVQLQMRVVVVHR